MHFICLDTFFPYLVPLRGSIYIITHGIIFYKEHFFMGGPLMHADHKGRRPKIVPMKSFCP